MFTRRCEQCDQICWKFNKVEFFCILIIFQPTLCNLCQIGQIFLSANGQILKTNIAIWSRCFGIAAMITSFWITLNFVLSYKTSCRIFDCLNFLSDLIVRWLKWNLTYTWRLFILDACVYTCVCVYATESDGAIFYPTINYSYNQNIFLLIKALHS